MTFFEAPRLRQRGMSIIELLVGVFVGMIVVAGAVKLMMDTLGSNRRLLLETRVNQDLRAAADLIARDIRRAGYWENATSGVFTATGSGTVIANPYRDIELSSNVIRYQYGRQEDNPSKYDTVESVELAGFRLNNGVLEFRNGAADPADPNTDNWQAITDPKVVSITNLTITPATARVVELYAYCACLTKLDCDENDFKIVSGTEGACYSTRPTMTIRQYDVVVAGQSATDPTVQREIRETVRVRNDRMEGRCYTKTSDCP